MLENAKRQLFLVFLTVLAGIACAVFMQAPLGADLQGGTQLRYEVPADVLEKLVSPTLSVDKIMEESIAVIAERIDPDGTLDPLITRSGETDILIEMPYFENKQQEKLVLDRIANIGRLEMRIVADRDYVNGQVTFNMQGEKTRLESWLKNPENKKLIAEDPRNVRRFNEDAQFGPLQSGRLAWYPSQIRGVTNPDTKETRWDTPLANYLKDSTVKGYEDADFNQGVVPESFLKKAEKDRFLVEFVAINMDEEHFSGEDLDPAGVGASSGRDGGLAVSYAIKAGRTGAYAEWSERYIGKASAIILNGYIKSAPTFRSKIPGNGIIEGKFTQEEVDELVKVLRTGSLRVEPQLQSRLSIGPTLGREAILRGLISLLAGGVLVFGFMLVYYRIAGTIACVTLLLNMLLLYAAMVFMQATITLPGLGGIVLTMGMAVDANVLIYERIREELQRGKDLLRAVRAGFERAMSAILDSNITTFLVGIVLYNVGVGPVRGFAVTLMVGIVATVFTQFFVTRLLFHYALERKLLDTWQPRRWLDGMNVQFSRMMGRAILFSLVVITAGISYALFVAPRDVTLGTDFTGGANLQMVFAKGSDKKALEKALEADAEFHQAYPNATVNTVGDADGGSYRQFNVRLKLTDAQRELIDAERTADRQARAAAAAAEQEPPPAYTPPYVKSLQRIFQGQLVQPAFSDPMANKHTGNNANLQIAQVTVHLQSPVEVAKTQAELLKKLPGCTLTPIGDENAAQATDLVVEWTTQTSVRPWQFAGLLLDPLQSIKDINDKPLSLSDPFPEAQEIQGRLVNDLRNAAIGALILSWGLIVLYLRVRFHEYRYGFAAVIALVHDVLVTFGVVVFVNHMGWVHVEISMSMIACFLTIIGYSVNDTIIIFDRIRENRVENARQGINEPIRHLIDRSLNQTLSRTILTSLLTMLTVLAQFLVNWGSESDLESFAFGMLVGMISGVYSSVYIAAPILVWMDKNDTVVPPEPVTEPADANAPAQ
ncbi:MAG: protein translocase subunit SecD [Planctomycetes bacterium]|nr:protein translocase subunit SecD [Planctomycetota bacterium]